MWACDLCIKQWIAHGVSSTNRKGCHVALERSLTTFAFSATGFSPLLFLMLYHGIREIGYGPKGAVTYCTKETEEAI